MQMYNLFREEIMWNFLGGIFKDAITKKDPTTQKDIFEAANLGWLRPIATFLDNILIPFIIIVLVAGAIWIVLLGIKLARAEDTTKADEAKKKLINVAISIVAVIVFIFLLAFVASNIPTWIKGSNPFSPASV